MKGLTQETRDIFRNFPKYKLSQSNAAKLSRLEPKKQKTAAILLASYQIQSVDKYQPEEGGKKSPRKPKRDKELLEIVAELKDPTKKVSKSPDMFLSEYSSMVYKIQQQIDSYCEPYYEESVRSLSASEIDELQAKMQRANSPRFEHWAKIFNLKEMAKTVIYLQENGLTDLGELEKPCDVAVQKYNALSDQTKAASARMKDILELQKHIGAYIKTREIYAQYRKLPPRKQEKFYDEHSSEIRACQTAKRHFDSLGLKKLPSIQSLKQEYATLQAENKKRYPEQKQAKEKMIELLTAKNNVERILGVTEKEKNRDRQQEMR